MYMQAEVLDLPNMVFHSIKCFNKCLGQNSHKKTYQNSTSCESENEILRLH